MVSKKIIPIFGPDNLNSHMEVISSREFRSKQTKYLGMAARGEGVILKTRSLGSFKITPLSQDDTLMSKEEFFRRVDKAREEILAGKGTVLKTRGEVDAFLDSL